MIVLLPTALLCYLQPWSRAARSGHCQPVRSSLQLLHHHRFLFPFCCHGPDWGQDPNGRLGPGGIAGALPLLTACARLLWMAINVEVGDGGCSAVGMASDCVQPKWCPEYDVLLVRSLCCHGPNWRQVPGGCLPPGMIGGALALV